MKMEITQDIISKYQNLSKNKHQVTSDQEEDPDNESEGS